MKEKIAIVSIIANLFLAVTKVLVGLFSGSTAILAAGIDSSVDILSSTIGYVGIRASKKPADKEHPYGHYKYEVLSGLAITLIILASGTAIGYESIQRFFKPQNVTVGYLAFGVMAVSALVNLIMSRLKISYGKKENSVSLLSDGIHSRIDVYSSLVILLGLFFIKYWIYADAFFALLMSIYIIKEAFSVGKEAIDCLLDVSAGEEIEEKIKSIAEKEKIKLDSLKTQKKGSAVTANLEINLPSNLKVEEATKISENLRKKMMEKIDNLSYISIQIKSHEIETGFYKPKLGRGFGWQRHGKFKGEIKEAKGQGVGGYCVCPKCGYKTAHQRGIPCSTLQCPSCKISLERQ